MRLSILLSFLAASVLACPAALGQLNGNYPGTCFEFIPPSGSGGTSGWCGAGSADTASFAISVPDAFVLSHVNVQLLCGHQNVGDLTLTLSHCGTSVVLYDRLPASSSNLSGIYGFDDAAASTFAGAVGAQPATVPAGTYSPVNPLSAFNGMSSAGDWTIWICDHHAGDTGLLTQMVLDLHGEQVLGGAISPALAIPDGYQGCVSPVARAITVMTPGLVDTLEVTLGLHHTFVNDLDISIAHDGVVVTLSGAGSIAANVGVQGLYTFANPNGSLTSFDLAAGGAGGGNVPSGIYLPDQPLAAFAGHSQLGVWLITICDGAAIDTGYLDFASISFSSSPYALTLSQPSGTSWLLMKNSGGSPGRSFVNLATLVPGSFPNGWLNGLDIGVSDVVSQLSFGSPFVGALDGCGLHNSIVAGPIPSGIWVQLTSFELDQLGQVVASVPAFQYHTS
jgi:subtilisin-like proprotein convertase family protein